MIFVHRNGECSVVEPQFCRNEPFERFAFTVSEEGIPRLAEIPTQTEERNQVLRVLEEAFGGSIERITRVNKLVDVLGVEKHTAQMRVKRLIDRGMLRLHDGVVSLASNGVTE